MYLRHRRSTIISVYTYQLIGGQHVKRDLASNTLWIFEYLCYRYSTSDRLMLNQVMSDVLHNIYESKKKVLTFVIFPQGFFAFNFSYLT